MGEEECVSLLEVEEEGSVESLRAWFFLRPSISAGELYKGCRRE